MENNEKNFIIKSITNELDLKEAYSFPELFDKITYFYYLSIFYENKDKNKYSMYLEKSKMLLNKIMAQVRQLDIPMGSWYGFTGIAYATRTILGECENLSIIEEFIMFQSKRLIINKKYDSNLFNGQYDVLNGMTGILAYMLRYRTDKEKYIETSLSWMIHLFDEDKDIFDSDKLLIKGELITNPIFKKNFYEGYIDLGVSHGIIDFLYVFSLAISKGIECSGLIETYDKLLNFYIKLLKENEQSISNWPQLIYLKDNNRYYHYQNRFGWCYGKLGILRVLYCISKNTLNTGLENYIIKEMKKVNLDEIKKTELNCPTFCHGYTGLYHISNLFYEDTKDAYFKELSARDRKSVV